MILHRLKSGSTCFGSPVSAARSYEKAIAIQPNFAPVRRDLGMLQFQQQNYAQAAEHLSKAAELGLDEAPLFNFLGISYSRTDRLPKAVSNYAEAHLNLAFAYQRQNRPPQAKREYDRACQLDSKLCRFVPGRTQ